MKNNKNNTLFHKVQAKLARPVSVIPNGIQVSVTEDNILCLNFFGDIGTDGIPLEILGSYAFSLKEAEDLITRLQDAVDHAKQSNSK